MKNAFPKECAIAVFRVQALGRERPAPFVPLHPEGKKWINHNETAVSHDGDEDGRDKYYMERTCAVTFHIYCWVVQRLNNKNCVTVQKRTELTLNNT